MTSTDAGLAFERTNLAWQRTGLSHAVAGVVIFRLLPNTPARPVVALTMIAIGAVTSVGTRRLVPGRPHRGWLLFLATATTAAALAASTLSLLD